MSRMAKYYVPAVTLAAIALTAYLQASIALHLFGAALVLDKAARIASGAHSVGAGAASALGAAREEKTAEAILSRNPFDSVTGSLIDERSRQPGQRRASALPIRFLHRDAKESAFLSSAKGAIPSGRWPRSRSQVLGQRNSSVSATQ